MTVTLVLGGARSGKSRFAERLMNCHAHRTYIATAEAFDDEMRQRIAQHRLDRGPGWRTLEAPLDLVPVLSGCDPNPVLIDCLTVWIGNLMHHRRDVLAEIDSLCVALALRHGDVVAVSNEVGLSVVPDNAMARQFRDYQGLANQRIAAMANEVYFIAAGLPITLKK